MTARDLYLNERLAVPGNSGQRVSRERNVVNMSDLLIVCSFLQYSFITPLCQPVECPTVQQDEQGEDERAHQLATQGMAAPTLSRAKTPISNSRMNEAGIET
jgi:hypothetical protein